MNRQASLTTDRGLEVSGWNVEVNSAGRPGLARFLGALPERAAVGHDLEGVGDAEAHTALDDVLRVHHRDLGARVVHVELTF